MKKTLAAALVAAALAACTGVDLPAQRSRAGLESRIGETLAQRGMGADALSVTDNLVRHEGPPPPVAQPLVRELLADPLRALDADALFRRLVPPALAQFGALPAPAAPQRFDEILAAYIEELAVAQRDLRAATSRIGMNEAAVIRGLAQGELPVEALVAAAAAIDAPALERANLRFLDATARFAAAVRTARDLPQVARRFDSPIGVVSIGTMGADHHGPDAALIVDPGGDDLYERAPATGGAVSVIVDLGGNDRYRGTDIAVRGLSAIVDLAGNDRYEMVGAGLGAAIAGASLVFDAGGDDLYRAAYFGQGAAAFGIGALIDLAGDDRYEILAFGQAFGLGGGLALLWDRAGNDRYTAQGLPDPFGRNARISAAQGHATGFRTMLGGGAAILRDDAGNDAYDAEMFAQGTGYYYGLGILWDRGGDDRYKAVRYAQGTGVHEAVGLLRDEAGNDSYELGFGVGQGMGLDLALGVLVDAAGDDRYLANILSQGTATANGIGLLVDGGGADRWEMRADARAWGLAPWWRNLPSLGLLLHEKGRGTFQLGGQTLAEPPLPHRMDEKVEPPDCAKDAAPPSRAALAGLRREHFDAVLEMGQRIRCAPPWDELERLVAADPQTPLGASIAIAMREHPPSAAQRDAILRRLAQHPRCSVRAAALVTQADVGAAQAALGSTCYLLQAAALDSLKRLGGVPAPDAALPSFLRK